MKRLLVAGFLLAGCAMRGSFDKDRFVKLDQGFKSSSRAEPPRVFVDANEMTKEKAPPYRFVGVVEVEGIQTERLSLFYERVAEAGRGVGCEAMLQRDAFQGVAPDPTPLIPAMARVGGKNGTPMGNPGGASTTGGGGGAYHNNLAIWQFLCGVGGATQDEAEATFKQADARHFF